MSSDWSKKKLSKLQRGSVNGFLIENRQIHDLDVLDTTEQEEIDKILQIRHLYSHRNGIIDEKFLQFYPDQFNINEEHNLSINEMLKLLTYLLDCVDRIDKEAIKKFQLATFD